MSSLFLLCFLLFVNLCGFSQNYTHQDTLRGSIGQGRLKWNVVHYNITVKPDINSHMIEGLNEITILDSGAIKLQIDLQEPMMIDSIIYNKKNLTFSREGNVYWVDLTHEYQETNIQIKKIAV